MTTLIKETHSQTPNLKEIITRLKTPLERSFDEVLPTLLEIILELSPEKRAKLIELISRSMPSGYLRVSYIPPQSTPPVTDTTDMEWVSEEMDDFLADYTKRKETDVANNDL